MKETNKKECPDCGNADVFQTRSYEAMGGKEERSAQKLPTYSMESKNFIYQCRKCNSFFIYTND